MSRRVGDTNEHYMTKMGGVVFLSRMHGHLACCEHRTKCSSLYKARPRCDCSLSSPLLFSYFHKRVFWSSCFLSAWPPPSQLGQASFLLDMGHASPRTKKDQGEPKTPKQVQGRAPQRA